MDNKNQLAILQAMLNHIKVDDPKIRSLIKEEINNGHKKQKEIHFTNEVIRRLKIQNKKLLQQVAYLKDQVKQMKGDSAETQNRLNQIIKLNNLLAGALGSCHKCWGEDQHCSYCSGNGSPGWMKSNRRLFNLYVLPTLENLYGLSEKMK